MKELLLNVESKEMRLAVLHHGKLVDLMMERKKSRQLSGNIYKGFVTNILDNIQSAFIDIGESDNGFIHISDIIENTQKFQEMFDIDFEWEKDDSKNEKVSVKTIDQVLKPKQSVLVQVVKEPIGSKGARLTSNISLPGRFLVMLPNSPHRGVSRKIQDRVVRDRLKKTIRAFEMPKEVGLICRTASSGATTDQLIDEAAELMKTWEGIVEEFQQANEAACIHTESSLVKKAVIMAIDKKFDRILVDHYPTYKRLKQFYKKYEDEHTLTIEMYRDKTLMFERFCVERELEKATRRKYWLPSGGYLYFDKTEAMFTIDVNSGRSTTSSSSKNVDETLVKINMEAAVEIARQLRIRNVGGLVICDFIDMQSRKNQRRVLDKLKESLKDDSAKCTVLGMSEFGLVEMTRQRNRESLLQTMFTTCPYCNGKGVIKNNETISIEIERVLNRLLNQHSVKKLHLIYHPHLDHYLSSYDRSHFKKLAAKKKTELIFESDDSLHLNDFEFRDESDACIDA